MSTSRVGDFVISELAKLDKVAYIRFASVYRSFETPDDFRDAVQEVKASEEEAQVISAFSAFDHAMMRRALELAERGLYTTTPNPRVGCVDHAARGSGRRRLAREGRRAARRGRARSTAPARAPPAPPPTSRSSPATTKAARRRASTR